MARLEGGILPVIGEGKEFPGLFLESGFLLEPPDRSIAQDGGGCASSLGTQCPESSEVLPLRKAVGDPAIQAETEGGLEMVKEEAGTLFRAVNTDADRVREILP